MAEQKDTDAVKRPVKAVCKSVRRAQETTLSYHGVRTATVNIPAYRPVRQIHGTELTWQDASQAERESLPVQQTEMVSMNELAFDNIKSKKVENNLTLRELFSGQEGY